jgi:hypothetical protein
MKNVRLTLGVMLLACTLVFIRCTPDVPLVSTTKEVLIQGKWGVQYYFDGQDRTAQFQGYEFSFSGSGVATITNPTDTVSANWVITKNTKNQDVLTMNIDAQASSLTNLNYDWTVETMSFVNVGMKNVYNVQLIMRKL